MRFLAGVLVGIAVPGAAALLFLGSGLFEVSAAVPPSTLETRLARFALDRSITRRAPRATNPIAKGDADALREGGEHYKGMCVACHGAPGVDPSEAGEGLNPPAPDLTLERVQRRSDGELFWIVQNGIRMSGMPAFGATHKERQIWEIVAFLRHLPSITPDEEKALEAATKHAD
jgi:mono/diheme cytochrome c family protein